MITKDTIIWHFFSFCHVHAVISLNKASSLLENGAHAKLFIKLPNRLQRATVEKRLERETRSQRTLGLQWRTDYCKLLTFSSSR